MLSQEFIIWLDAEGRDLVNDVFTISLALSVMKPLIPQFVARGLAAINAEHMLEPIRETFQDKGLIRVARLPETYALAIAELPADVTAVPEEVEEEENIGEVVGDNQLDELNQVFDVAVRVFDDLDNEILELSDSSDSEEEENDIVNTRRVRKSSVMVGSIKRGKYRH